MESLVDTYGHQRPITYDRICIATHKHQHKENKPCRQTKLLQNMFSFKTGHLSVDLHASHWISSRERSMPMVICVTFVNRKYHY
jgi:hypothetical protein